MHTPRLALKTSVTRGNVQFQRSHLEDGCWVPRLQFTTVVYVPYHPSLTVEVLRLQFIDGVVAIESHGSRLLFQGRQVAGEVAAFQLFYGVLPISELVVDSLR